MEFLLKEHDKLERKANLSVVTDDVQVIIDHLYATKDAIARNTESTTHLIDAEATYAAIAFDRTNVHLKDIYSTLGKYSKIMERKFKDKPHSFADHDTLSMQSALINRAIAMHLLREGHFDVATTFVSENNGNIESLASYELSSMDSECTHESQSVARRNRQTSGNDAICVSRAARATELSPAAYQPESLHQQFQEMYQIVNFLRLKHDLGPAIEWARAHRAVLESRGSNLEFDLCQLQYIHLFTSAGPKTALSYAKETFSRCPVRYAGKIQRLIGALAFIPNISGSPYGELFSTSNEDTILAAASAFTAEFCALLSLSSASPLLTAVTAGCIAVPTLLKLSQIQALHRTSWTTASELPVEVPLPVAYRFHSIFVCPVSKEQSTDENPPMMMPCHHVICKESLEKISKSGRFKCPYCPAESQKDQAKRILV